MCQIWWLYPLFLQTACDISIVNIISLIVLLQLVVAYSVLLSYTTHFNFVSCISLKTIWQFKNLVFKPSINKPSEPRYVFLIPYIFQGSNFYFCLSLYCF